MTTANGTSKAISPMVRGGRLKMGSSGRKRNRNFRKGGRKRLPISVALAEICFKLAAIPVRGFGTETEVTEIGPVSSRDAAGSSVAATDSSSVGTSTDSQLRCLVVLGLLLACSGA